MIKTDFGQANLCDVKITDGYLVNAFKKETDYLVALSVDRLLAGFYETAGIAKEGIERYGGWENMLIGGHTLGHYLAACVYAFESGNSDDILKKKLFEKISGTVNGLKECQDNLSTGFVFGAVIKDKSNVELQFDLVEQGKTDIIRESWVPWYTLHKIYEGLLAAARLEGVVLSVKDGKSFDVIDSYKIKAVSDTALTILSRLADWTYKRTSGWDEKTHRTVLNIEYGGMNDVLFDTYTLTHKKEHLDAALSFCDRELYGKIINGRPGDNVLDNHHANTTIPKLVGAVRGYLVTGDEFLLEAGKAFWKAVTELHTYITGGNSEWEHFGRDGILNAERTNCNCETCNVYNMLKLTLLLFDIFEDKKYLDWYENAFINQILSSQNPETGMTTYFQPMATGYFKTFGNPTGKFWCCTGTGMENFSKLGESFYLQYEDIVVVNQYFSSRYCSDGLEFEQESEIPLSDITRVRIIKNTGKKLAFRIPDWLAGNMILKLIRNKETIGKTVVDFKNTEIIKSDIDSETGFNGLVILNGPVEAGDVIDIEMPMKVVAYNLPDNEYVYGFKYGPVVLSALLGDENMETEMTGVDVTIPKAKVLPAFGEKITIDSGSVMDFMLTINDHMIRRNTPELSFVLKDCVSELVYTVHYSQYRQRYGIYFEFGQ